MKLIKIQSCHMGVIFTPNNMTRQRQQCVNTNTQIMRYHTVNVYCDVVPNLQALILLTRKQIIIIPTPVLQLVFTFIIWLYVVQTWQASVKWQETFPQVSTGYWFRTTKKIYTRKELVMMETTIYNFHTSSYIPEI